jgi:hypothetical protein
VPVSSLLESIDFALHLALESRFGIEILIHDFGEGAIVPAQRVQKIIFRYRHEVGNPELMRLTIDLHPSDPDHKLWIYKTEEVFGSKIMSSPVSDSSSEAEI